MAKNEPIGVFDSGLGGLTVVRQIRKDLPFEQVIYFGDLARLPYGIKSKQQIFEFSKQNAEFLLRLKIKALVIACNSSSSVAFDYLRSNYQIPVVDVIKPAACEAARETRNFRIGIIGTQATVDSKAYEIELKRLNPKIKVFAQACPLLVPLVEEGIMNEPLTDHVLKRYLSGLLKKKIDTLILGCTHYPLLQAALKRVVGKNIQLVSSAPAAVEQLQSKLEQRNILRGNGNKGKLKVFVSDRPRNFEKIGSRFLGESLDDMKVVRLKGEIFESWKWVS
ncbi:MAG: glutamate racemase [Omnitrophica bacterium RIFCSPLOWO2_12_FULL_44_17]|uniref:Glutamate racemase n=1 Tax=Candidatus Danuiimicrobium aquiferis TaxID=1801832 RepID=A0A1G1KTA3_9BACT|nr:MAG: glutamate racemase [Omnitrophica bacterium RIFCSPHIGHO2_02_FULL_45_28]OGW88804.1 MAG: glutamate racemase [Omnitrophica bacterium RIFCSPHIGHO2_12_FULL_44_12]OGW96012.1 MAG: glutamate racemase [Omnitrophica bacterium RIFCSPLOWO2_12_FULL_44_17]OGX03066.1 MAG: glutamate racemase [Omnitrophica bacterium RIFCSPLOWO2_02_FULL_44_11]